MYSIVTLTLTFSIYYLLKSLRDNKFKNKLLFSLFSYLSFLTFYGSIFLIIPVFIYLLYKKRYKIFLFSFLIFTFSVILLSPLLYEQLINAKQQLALVVNWNKVLGTSDIKNFLLIPIKFSIGRISFYPKWFYWSISLVWTGFIWYFIVMGRLKNKLLFFLLMATLVLGVLFSFFTPVLQYFRFLYLIPLISLLIASGLSKFHLRRGNWIAALGFIFFSLIYLLNSTFHREDWKSLAEGIDSNKVYMIYTSSDPLQYYRKDIEVIDLKKIAQNKIIDKDIYIIPYSSDIHYLNYKNILSERKYKLEDKITYRGLILEKWKRYGAM